MTLLLKLVAHGATLATRRAAFPADEPLLEDKRGTISPFPWRSRTVLTSPARACRQMVNRLGLDAEVDPALCDLDHGRWSGRTLADVAQTEPDAIQRWLADPGFYGHGGESRDQLAERMVGWLDRIVRMNGPVVGVTHAAVIRALVLRVLDAPPGAFWSFDIVPATATDLRYDGRRWALRGLGCPLPDRLRAEGA